MRARLAALTTAPLLAFLYTSAGRANIMDPSQIADLNNLLKPEVTNAFIKTIGLGAIMRPYEPATPLGTKIGLDFGVELTLSKIPDDLNTAMTEAGAGGGDNAGLPAFPVPRFHIHKGIGERVDVGIAGMWYPRGFDIIKPIEFWGVDLKAAVFHPEEGPTVSLRFCYTSIDIMVVSAKSYEPQILISRALDFADPYIGAGYTYTKGTLTYSREIIPGQTVTISGNGQASGFTAFSGVQFHITAIGLQLTLEGSYNTAGTHSLGTKLGLRF
jgi:hypothetical protein